MSEDLTPFPTPEQVRRRRSANIVEVLAHLRGLVNEAFDGYTGAGEMRVPLRESYPIDVIQSVRTELGVAGWYSVVKLDGGMVRDGDWLVITPDVAG